ncbi:MAG: hypothetical protein JKY49_16500 [Cohaesibacteraceae bacterium]|nr:hypothetical protein [Cohaesibacteraceae bacterium]
MPEVSFDDHLAVVAGSRLCVTSFLRRDDTEYDANYTDGITPDVMPDGVKRRSGIQHERQRISKCRHPGEIDFFCHRCNFRMMGPEYEFNLKPLKIALTAFACPG